METSLSTNTDSAESGAIPRRLYLMVWATSPTTTESRATHELTEARAMADTGALVIEYGKVGLVRAGGGK